jgi:hypothetical protein
MKYILLKKEKIKNMRMKIVDCKCEKKVKPGYKGLGKAVGVVWRERYLPPTRKLYHL